MRLLLLALLVAAGITQPGGAGTTIFFEDSSHADAGGDGAYSFADIAAKFPVDFIDNGTAEKSYRSKVTLQNGDGSGTAVTVMSDTLVTVVFDASKTYATSNIGQSNRTTQWGTKINNFAAKDGCKIRFATTPVMRGTMNLYGCQLRSGQGFTMLPGFGASPVPGVGELIGNTFNAGNTNSSFGSPSSGNFAVIQNNNFVGVGVNGFIANFGGDSEDGSVFSGTGMSRFISSAVAQLNLSRPRFTGSPTNADIRDVHGSGIDWNFAEPTWSQNAVQFEVAAGVSEWWGFGVEVFDSKSPFARLANISVELIDVFGATVVDAVTDSEGQISFNSGVALNRVKLRRHTTGPTITEQGPFLLKANHKGTINYTYATLQQEVVWPGRDYAFGRQLQNVFLSVQLQNVTGTPTPWNERVAP